MKTSWKKIRLAVVLGLLSCCLFTGCKASKKKVLSSTYYKELKEDYQKLQKENKKLKDEAKVEEGISADEQRALDYLDKIARDHLVKLEVGHADNMEGSEFVEDETVFSLATAIAKRADLTQKYTPKEVEEKYGPGYEYVLYDEDNAVYEIMIYGGNYVVFNDLPNNVYYAYNASAIGDAFLHFRDGYPNSTLFHRLADAALITDADEHCLENTTAVRVANSINRMEKKKSSRKKAEEAWKKAGRKKSDDGSYAPKGSSYTFYHHGSRMILTLYDTYLYIENMNGDRTWYRTEKENIKEIKKIFKDSIAQLEEELSDTKESKESSSSKEENPSHEKEIEEESVFSE